MWLKVNVLILKICIIFVAANRLKIKFKKISQQAPLKYLWLAWSDKPLFFQGQKNIQNLNREEYHRHTDKHNDWVDVSINVR